MNKKLGIFLTTHLHSKYRHNNSLENILLNNYKKVIDTYIKFNSNKNYDVYIMDTGSKIDGFNEYIDELNEKVTYLKIPNNGGCFASIKYLMHINKEIIDKYDYFLFSVDDYNAGHPKNINWEKDMIDKYNTRSNIGLMCRYVDTIKLGPKGLVDHRNCAQHIGKIWGLKEPTLIPHTHADWQFIDQETLKQLSDVWYDPINSIESMDYQKKWENEDFCLLADMDNKNRKILDDIHIGRETDLALRIHYLNKKCKSYDGTSFWPNAVEEFIHWKYRNCNIKGYYGEWKYN